MPPEPMHAAAIGTDHENTTTNSCWSWSYILWSSPKYPPQFFLFLIDCSSPSMWQPGIGLANLEIDGISEPKALAAQEMLATGLKHVCTHLWYTSFKRESESYSLHNAISTGKTQGNVVRTTGDEKDSSVQFTLIWSLIGHLSKAPLGRSLFIVFVEVCTIISAGIQGANDQIGNSNWEGDSWQFQPTYLQKTVKMRGISSRILNNSCSSTRRALGFSVLRFWLFFRSVFRFLCQNNSFPRFWWSLWFVDFPLFCIWLSVFGFREKC